MQLAYLVSSHQSFSWQGPKEIVQTEVQDYLTQIFALILYKPRTLHPKSSDWLRSQKTHTVTETQRERERLTATERDNGREERETITWLANECQGMLYISSHHASASFNTALCDVCFGSENGAYILKNVTRAKAEWPWMNILLLLL